MKSFIPFLYFGLVISVQCRPFSDPITDMLNNTRPNDRDSWPQDRRTRDTSSVLSDLLRTFVAAGGINAAAEIINNPNKMDVLLRYGSAALVQTLLSRIGNNRGQPSGGGYTGGGGAEQPQPQPQPEPQPQPQPRPNPQPNPQPAKPSVPTSVGTDTEY